MKKNMKLVLSTMIRRMVGVSVLLVVLASAWPAQAFYNPSSGRWLSRDPIEEKGHVVMEKFSRSPIQRPEMPAPGGIAPRRSGGLIAAFPIWPPEPSNQERFLP
jgi:hypothetical protein